MTTTQALVWKTRCSLSANQKRESKFNPLRRISVPVCAEKESGCQNKDAREPVLRLLEIPNSGQRQTGGGINSHD